MTATALPARPGPGEYAPFYAPYLDAVPAGDLLTLLDVGAREWQARLGRLDDAQALRRYAPGKWSVKEVLLHVADAERVFAYRALRFARGDATPLPGFDENAFVAASGADARPLAGLLAEFEAVRRASIALFASFGAEAWARTGTASGRPVSVRALAWIVVGHASHHLRVLGEKYGA